MFPQIQVKTATVVYAGLYREAITSSLFLLLFTGVMFSSVCTIRFIVVYAIKTRHIWPPSAFLQNNTKKREFLSIRK